MTTNLAIINPSELKEIVKDALKEHDVEKRKEIAIEYYSIHRTGKIIGRSDRTVRRLIKDGIIKATKDNRISSLEIENYLGAELVK